MATLAETRLTLHAVAEHVLAGARFQAVGKIGLVVIPGGFATPPYGDAGTILAVRGTELLVNGTRHPFTTLRDLAHRAGIEPEAPTSYEAATDLDPDAELLVDPGTAVRLEDWFALGDNALRQFAPELVPTLWPEHFDVGIRLDDVNYGVSPGDDEVPEPYLYVGPDSFPSGGGFWNAPFGAVRTWSELETAADALTFFREGSERIAQHAT